MSATLYLTLYREIHDHLFQNAQELRLLNRVILQLRKSRVLRVYYMIRGMHVRLMELMLNGEHLEALRVCRSLNARE